MKKYIQFIASTIIVFLSCIQGYSQLKFRQQMIAAESPESVGVFDVNGDKVLDIVSGSYWYKGPLYLDRHLITQLDHINEYHDDFSTIPMAVSYTHLTLPTNREV